MHSRRVSDVVVRMGPLPSIRRTTQHEMPRSRRVSIVANADGITITSEARYGPASTINSVITNANDQSPSSTGNNLCSSSRSTTAIDYSQDKADTSPSFQQIPTYRKVGTVLWRKSVNDTRFTIVRKYVFCKENDPYASSNSAGHYFIFLKDGLLLPVEKRRIEFFKGGEAEAEILKQEMMHWPKIAPLNDLVEEQAERLSKTVTPPKTEGSMRQGVEGTASPPVQEKAAPPEAGKTVPVTPTPLTADRLGPLLPLVHASQEEERERKSSNLLHSSSRSPSSIPAIQSPSVHAPGGNNSERTSTCIPAHPGNSSGVFPRLRMLPSSRSGSFHSQFSTPNRVMLLGTIMVKIPESDVLMYEERINKEGCVEFDVFGQEMLGIRPYYVDYKGEKVVIKNRKSIKFDRLGAYNNHRRRSSSVDRAKMRSSVLTPFSARGSVHHSVPLK